MSKFLRQGDSADDVTADKAEEKNSDTDSDLRPAKALASQATRLSLLHPANRLAGLAWPGNCECWEGSSDFLRSSRGSADGGGLLTAPR